MKKVFMLALAVLAFALGVNAQTVISNNYESPITGGTSADDDGEESIGVVGITYYSFDGFDNWGVAMQAVTPNAFGYELGIRANFEDHGNYSVDLGANYSFKLYGSDNLKVLLTLAAGPSFRWQDQYEIKSNEYKSKFLFDAYVNARIGLKFNRIMVSGGYFLWAPKFKFGKEKADGFNVTLAYCF